MASGCYSEVVTPTSGAQLTGMLATFMIAVPRQKSLMISGHTVGEPLPPIRFVLYFGCTTLVRVCSQASLGQRLLHWHTFGSLGLVLNMVLRCGRTALESCVSY